MTYPTTAASTRANLADAYKELFPQKRMDNLAVDNNPLLKWLPKADDLEGDGIHIPIRWGRPQGKSSAFTSMQGAHSSGKVSKVFIERKKYYGGVSIDDEAIESARSRKGAFYSVKEAEMEDLITELGSTLQTHLWKTGWGTLGQVASVSSETATLTNPEDAINFQPGQTIVADTVESGGTVHTGSAVVESVDYDAGTFTLVSGGVAAINAATGFAANDYVFNVGDYYAAGTTVGDGNLVTGLAGWIPAVAETSGTFLGMDRTTAVQLLQGFRQAYLGSIEETIKKQRSVMGRIGAKADSIWLADANWHRLEMELGSRAVRMGASAGTFGLPALKYSTPHGSLPIYADPYCPEDVGYQLKRDTWKLHHLKGLPHIVMTDGMKTLRGLDFDGITMRARMWMELACNAPKHNGRFAIS